MIVSRKLRIMLAAVSLICLSLFLYSVTQAEKASIGESIIDSYIDDNIDALGEGVRSKGSDTYIKFLRDVIMGEYIDLTGSDSKYIRSQSELDEVLRFITSESRDAGFFDSFPDEPQGLNEVLP